MIIDPICKAQVSKDSDYVTEYGGKSYHFCSDRCKSKFDKLEKSVIRLKRNIGDQEKISFGRLNKEIIKSGICTLCGACVASCEYVTFVDNKPKLVGKCTACGVCYNQCPRTITKEEDLIGKIRYGYAARSAIPGLKGQDGGVVTSMLAYALDEGLLDCAIVTKRSEDEPWKAEPVIVRTSAEVLESAGSIYTHSMTLEPLMSAIKQEMGSIGFVGPSCNIDAVHKMQTSSYGFLHLFLRARVLKFGLFCMDSFEHDGIKEFVESKEMDLNDIHSMKIRKGFFEFATSEGVKKYDLSELDQYRCTSCKFCTDMAAENTDISFGGVGTPVGWTTVLTRSSIGYEIFNEAVDSGYLEARPLEKAEMDRMVNLAKMKKVQMYTLNRRQKS